MPKRSLVLSSVSGKRPFVAIAFSYQQRTDVGTAIHFLVSQATPSARIDASLEMRVFPSPLPPSSEEGVNWEVAEA